ncbi:unnamed protein product [Staurois parvus]|jgi:hypothetical protein
MSTE